ncbi:MAG: TetR/AcrR family transcriptional regulator [Deltaproteobacteria bacterium]|nr:TetR/AcrR family transcriptional regulator [Deltaproteobacteria bacterium]
MSKNSHWRASSTALSAVTPTKAGRTQVAIIEAAIKNYASVGPERTTYETIASRCGLSRGIIYKYFSSQQALFFETVKYIRSNFQKIAIERIKPEHSPLKQLSSYIDATFGWLKSYPDHATIWALFYYYCGLNSSYRKLNTELVSIGRERIRAIIEAGKKEGIFHCADSAEAATIIQTAITGALIALSTENHKKPRILFEQTKRACLAIASGLTA